MSNKTKSNKYKKNIQSQYNLWVRILCGLLGLLMVLGIVLMIIETSVYSTATEADDTDEISASPDIKNKNLGISEKEISVGLCYGDSSVESFTLASASGFKTENSSQKELFEFNDISSMHVCIGGSLSFLGNKMVKSDEGVKVTSEYHIQIKEYAYKSNSKDEIDNPAPINPNSEKGIVTYSDFSSDNIFEYVNDLNTSGVLNDSNAKAYPAYINGKYYIRIGQFESEDGASALLNELSDSLILNRAEIVESDFGTFTFIDASNHKVICEIYTSDKKVNVCSIQGNLASVDSGVYSGYFIFSYGSSDVNKLNVVNKLLLEDYVASIINYEITDDYSTQSAMAVAVVLRTNAYNMLGRHKQNGFDVCTDSHCHSFGGVFSSDGNLREAVSSTEGQIISYKSRSINAAYCISNGTFTSSAASIFGCDDCPYLSSVDTSWDTSVNWQKNISPEELYILLSNHGYSDITSPVKSIAIESDSEESEYVNTVLITDILGHSVTVEGQDRIMDAFCQILPSMNFSVTVSNGTDGNNYGDFVFSGYGNGNGVGLSLIGALELANQGLDYVSILKKYYVDTEVIY